MINVIVCDNDTRYIEIAKKVIQETADGYQEEIWVDTYQKEEELLGSLERREDTGMCILLLNTDMLMDGKRWVIKVLHEQYPKLTSVFITGRAERALWELEYRPFWFVRRDRMEDELHHVLAMALEEVEWRTKKKIVVIDNRAKILLEVKDILYVKLVGRKVFCYLENGKVVEMRGTLKKFLEKVDDRRLIQISGSCAVNVTWVEQYAKGMVMLRDGKKFKVSRSKSKEAGLKIGKYWGV